MREKVLQTAEKEKIIAIVRGVESEKCLKVAQALYDGGIRMEECKWACCKMTAARPEIIHFLHPADVGADQPPAFCLRKTRSPRR